VQPLRGPRRARMGRTRMVRRILVGGFLGGLALTAIACVVASAAACVALATGAGARAPAAPAAAASPVAARPLAARPGAATQSLTGAAGVAALVRQVNDLRVRAGCSAVTRNPALQRAAQGYVQVLGAAGGVSHVDGVGGTAQDRARRQGYPGNVIELVAEGSLQPDEFVAGLTQLVNQSDLLDCRYRSFGAAVAQRHLVIVLGDR
jgi:uncharacterized protein YkwD